MNDERKDQEILRGLTRSKFDAITTAISPTPAELEDLPTRELFLHVLASHGAVLTAVRAGVEALRVSEMIPADSAEPLDALVIQLADGIQKAMGEQMLIDGGEDAAATVPVLH